MTINTQTSMYIFVQKFANLSQQYNETSIIIL